MSWVDQLKESLPDYAKDVRLNLDSVIKRSSINEELASACALAAAFATGNGKLVSFIQSNIADEKERDAALAAASIMAMTNIWYPYVEMVDDENLKGLPAQIRMNTIASHGGTTKANFEAFSLAASIVGKCEFCVKAHYDTLKNSEGYSVEQLRDIGRIASVMNSVARVLNS
jgi:alkyl hydroperoxide reductase subunit D